jgi:hypothetical protein
MKRMTKGIISVLVLIVVMIGAAWAAETKEEKNLSKEATQINNTAGSSQGEKVVVGRIEKEFSVTNAQIQGLRDQKMGYGEISTVFSLAAKMPGGITDTNIQQVMTLRQGPPKTGWGEVAKKLGTKLGPTVSQVKNVNSETHKEMMRQSENGKDHKEMHQDNHGEHQGEMMGHEGMGGMSGGEGMSHGKGR